MEILGAGRSTYGRVSKLVKHTAKEMAGSFYDGQDMFHDGRVERSTLFRIKARNQREFVNTYWRDFVVVARQNLGKMLSEPGRSQGDKDAIYDALLEERGAWTDEQIAAPSILRLN
jgi:hypothetical protein